MHLLRDIAWLALVLALPLSGEIVAPGGEEVAPANSASNADSNQGVYVRESAVALEKLALAQRMESHREWNKSADVFQEILESYPDRVIAAQRDSTTNNLGQYISVTTVVQERLSRWPREGLDVYRARYEAPASELLEQADRHRRDDFAALHKVFSLYFVTDTAKAAGMRLVDLYFESGEFPAAAWVADRMLRLHPNLIAERPMMLYRAALSHHLSGNSALAAERFKQLQTQHAGATGLIRGTDVALVDSLMAELKIPPPRGRHAVSDSWPMLGGSADRARISAATGRPGAKLFSVELSSSGLAGRRIAGLNSDQRKEIELADQRDRESGMMLGVMPVVDRGELFFQDGSRIYAVSLESGVPLPGWAATYGGERAGQYLLSGALPLPRNQQLSLTLTDQHVLAIMGFPDQLAMMMGLAPNRAGVGAGSETRLVCLDRASGRERWTISPAQLPVAALKTTAYSGSPLVVGDNVYLIGRGGKGMQFEDCYVICLDLHSGEFRWSCYIASANTTNQMWGGENMTFDQASHLAYSSGRLYVLSNLGALAAVDAYSGAIEWLTIYPRLAVNEFEEGMIRFRGRRGGASSSIDARPWTQNPAIVADGKVFVLPSDSPFILVYDAASGDEIKRIRLSDLRNCDTLLAVDGARMIVGGESISNGRPIGVLLSFNWQNYRFGSTTERANAAKDNGVILWRQEFSTPIRGRGFVTTDSVFVPTAERLFRININGGRIEESYPRYPGAWEKGEGPGNVLAAQDQVIIAGSRRVDVFTDMQVARAKLDAQVAENPADPEPRLRYAEVMFVAGQRELALAKLDEAIALIGGAGASSNVNRDRLFNDALTFARAMSDEDKPESSAMAVEMFNRADSAASSPLQKVNYRISRARFATRVRDYAQAIALYQEILSDAALRTVPLSDAGPGAPVQARIVAERAIETLIRTGGPSAYAPFEQQAANQFAQASQSGDPASLLAVAQVYPNSAVAPKALLAAADAFEAAGDSRQATQILRRSYFRYPGSEQRLRCLESLARNYLKMSDRLDVAIARLSQIAKADESHKISRPLTLPDGKTLEDATIGDALALLQTFQRHRQDQQLPDFHLPLPLTAEKKAARKKQPAPFLADGAPDAPRKIGPVDALVLPLRDHARHDRIVTFSAPAISVYEVGKSQPLFSSQALDAAPLQCAWRDDGRLLAWSADQIALIGADGGDAPWKIQLASLGNIEVVELNDPASDGVAATGRVIAPGQGQVEIRDNEVVIVANDELRQRRAIQQQIARLALPVLQINNPLAGENIAESIVHVVPLQDRIVIATSSGRLFALDAADGSIVWQARPTSQHISRLLATDDFTIALLSDDSNGIQIVALDTHEGSLINRWQFNPDTGVVPINVALSSDGMLVYTLPDRICGKDLFEPGHKLNYQEPPNEDAMGNPLYQGAGAVGQLLVENGRILAVSDNGQFVRVHSMETGKLIETLSDEQASMGLLKTESKNWNVTLRTAGPYLYVIGQQSLVAYNLDHPEQSWSKIVDSGTSENFRDAFVGRDYLVVLDQPGGAGAPNAMPRGLPGMMPPGAANQPAPAGDGAYRFLAFSRAQAASDGRESGLWVYDPHLPDSPKPDQWQAVEGGLYYVTKDNQLHFLRGARQEPLLQ